MLQVAIGVAGHLLRAQLLERGVHLLLRLLRRVEQHHLVVLDDVAGEKRGVVRHDLLRRKRLDLPQQIERQPLRARHRLVVEEVIDDAGRRLPARPPLLSHDRPALASRPGTVT